MEVLSPSPPRSPAVERYGPVSDAALRCILQRASPGFRDGLSGKLYVAVGRSPEKTLGLLRWAFRRFGCREIGLLHVHQPSPLIPTLLGKIPASQANENLLSSYRRIEWEETKKILLGFLSFCHKAQVHASFIVTETDQITNGIVDLVTQYGIRKLVMGSTSANCFKLKGSSSKAILTARNVPPSCEIWFVNKGRHIWTKEASEFTDECLPVLRSDETSCRQRIWLNPHSHNDELLLPAGFTFTGFGASVQGISSLCQNEPNDAVVSIDSDTCFTNLCSSQEHFSSAPSWHASPFDSEFPKEINSKDELEQDALCDQLRKVTLEIERLKRDAFLELAKRKQLESEVAEAINRVKAYESAHKHETKVREELEDLLRSIQLQREKLANQRDEALRDLQNIMETVTMLDSHANEMELLRDEAAGELELIQSSIKILKEERQKINQQEDNGYQFEKRTSGHGLNANQSQLNFYADDLYYCEVFTLSDLQTATCNFSENFKLGQGACGCLYKGEIMNKTVMIKKLHQHNIQSQVEFQQEVQVLSKMRHPHLMTLIGMCPEALSLVYEYMPNGTLQDCLFSRATAPPMTWRIRTNIASDISSALLFLHSLKPKKIVHGNLKPENIFLDYNYTCKLGNFGRCHLVEQDTEYNPFLCRYLKPQGTLPYIDPEYLMSEELTTKSDMYSFGIIILQLLTGKPSGFESEVRRAMSSGNLSSILDPSAGEWPTAVARRLTEIGLQCIELKAQDQPELTPELVKDLEQLHTIKERPIPSFFSCPILEEIMHDPQVAADGFTYEGKALQGWLESGRDTSPMTNMKLTHQNLTPNHALRFAIRDWLCQT